MIKSFTTVFIIVLIATGLNAQKYDSLFFNMDSSKPPSINLINNALKNISDSRRNLKSLIIPGALITYGFFSLGNDGLKKINEEIHEETWSEHPHQLKHIDNILQFAPAISVYGLNAMGIKAKNNFQDRSMIYILSNVILNATVFPLKSITHRLRPDSSAYTTFPSGHTAEAFASAEFLRIEYKDVSAWYGIAGYLLAATTGYLRMYNNKHWLGDVVAGAGIGILATDVAYYLEPIIAKKIFHKKLIRQFDPAKF